MRYFLTGRLPKVDSILLVESGTRGLLEGLIAGLRQAWGDQIPIDLVTCYATLPKGFEPHNTRVYRVGDYRGRAARGRLYRELAGNRYALVGIICSGEVVMAKWKWVLAAAHSGQAFHHQRERRLLLVATACTWARSGNLCSFARVWRDRARFARWCA